MYESAPLEFLFQIYQERKLISIHLLNKIKVLLFRCQEKGSGHSNKGPIWLFFIHSYYTRNKQVPDHRNESSALIFRSCLVVKNESRGLISHYKKCKTSSLLAMISCLFLFFYVCCSKRFK